MLRSQASYSLSGNTVQQLLRRLAAERPATNDGRFGCYRIADSSRYSDVARSVECTVFQEFFGNTPAVMTEAYEQYEAHSSFLLVVDRSSFRAAGTLRIITGSEHGLKTLNDLARGPLALPMRTVIKHHRIHDLAKCWDVGTVAVLKEYRGKANDHLISTMLYGLLHAEALKAGIEHFVAILDEHAYHQLTETLAVPFEPIVGTLPFDYLGSANSRAAHLHIPRVIPSVEAYMKRLEDGMRHVLQPYLARVIYAEGLPQVIAVS